MEPILIEEWAIVSDYYKAPEVRSSYIRGKVTGHPKHRNGVQVTTSSIVGRDGDFICTESGSLYRLGDPHPDYEKKYPDAKMRVLAHLTELEKIHFNFGGSHDAES